MVQQNQLQYSNEDRDRSIRTENEVRHLDTRLENVEVDVKALAAATRDTAYAIAAIVESLKDLKEAMKQAADDRARNEETHRRALLLEKRDADKEERLGSIETKLDRAIFLGKVVSAIIGSPVALYAISKVIEFIQTMPK